MGRRFIAPDYDVRAVRSRMIEHGVPLLYDDRDIEAIASVNPSLKLHIQPH